MAKLPIEEIAKAVSGAVSSVLSKMEAKNNSDDDDFQAERKRSKPRVKEVGSSRQRRGLGGRQSGSLGTAGPVGSKGKKANVKKRKVELISDNSSDDDDFVVMKAARNDDEVEQQDQVLESQKAKPTLPSIFIGKNNRRGSSKVKERLLTYNRDIVCLPKSYGQSTAISIPKSRAELGRNGLIGKITLNSSMSEEEIFSEVRSVFRVPMNHNNNFSFQVLQPIGGSNKSLTIPAVSSSFKWTASTIVPKSNKVPIYILAKEPLLKLSLSSEEGSEDELIDLTTEKTVPSSATVPTYNNESLDRLSEYGNIIDSKDWQSSPTPPPASPLTPLPSSSDLPVSEVLSLHRINKLPFYSSSEDSTRIIVRRKHILQDTLHKLRNGLDVSGHIRVVFVGEAAVDDGGPLREYFYLLMKSISEYSSIFCGPADNKVPRHNVLELQKKTYYYIGVLFGLSLIHGGPAPQFFSSAVADYIIYGASNVKARPLDVVDSEIREKIEKIQSVDSLSQLKELLDSDAYDFRYDIGISTPSKEVHLEDREAIVSAMSFHYGVLLVKAELDQILCGLSETHNILELVRSNAPNMRSLFVYETRPPLKANYVYDLLAAKFSDPGSNRREKEEAIMIFWYDFLKLIEGGKGTVEVKSDSFEISFEDILLFTTGMPFEPPLGFSHPPAISFDIVSPNPKSSTCVNTLYLPLSHSTMEDFTYSMCYGIGNTAGFGNV